jgi:hypothetical protein
MHGAHNAFLIYLYIRLLTRESKIDCSASNVAGCNSMHCKVSKEGQLRACNILEELASEPHFESNACNKENFGPG